MSEEFLKCSCRHCAGHIEFPASGEGAAINCPHCGQNTLLTSELLEPTPIVTEESIAPRSASFSRSRIGLATTIAVTVLLVGISSVALWFSAGQRKKALHAPPTSPSSASNPNVPTPVSERGPTPIGSSSVPAKATLAPKSADDLKGDLVTLEKAKGTGLVYAVGVLKNDSDHQRFGIRIEIEVIDSAGNKVGTAKDYRAVLEPRQAWRFRALVLDKRAAAARLVSIEEDQ
jgi:hypothetical protein